MKEKVSKLIKDIKSVGKKLEVRELDENIIFENKKFYLFGISSAYVLNASELDTFSFSFKRNDLLALKEKGAEYFITEVRDDVMIVTKEKKEKISKKETNIITSEHEIPIKKTSYKIVKLLESMELDTVAHLDLIELLTYLDSQESLISFKCENDSLFLKLGEDKANLCDIIKCGVLKSGISEIIIIPKTISTSHKLIEITKKNPEAKIAFNNDIIKFIGENVAFYVFGSK